MSPALMESLREQASIHRFSTPTVTFTAATKAYVLQAAWDAWVLLVSGRYKEAREHLQFAADMLGGCCPNEHRCGCDDPLDEELEPEHAEGCRCPECDPDYNDPRTDEERDEEFRREQADTARRLWKYPDPTRAK